jgi:hypothetical protein
MIMYEYVVVQDNYTPLMWAAKLNRCKAVQLLCQTRDVIVNAKAGWVHANTHLC